MMGGVRQAQEESRCLELLRLEEEELMRFNDTDHWQA